jgi:hypothetical protein
MSKILKEISCVTGQYTNASGDVKKRYQRIGSIIETKNGPMLKLDSIPLREGGWDGWAYMNDPRPVEGKEQPRRQASGFDAMPDEDLPF